MTHLVATLEVSILAKRFHAGSPDKITSEKMSSKMKKQENEPIFYRRPDILAKPS